MNTFTIKNGVLTVGGQRILLSQLCAYEYVNNVVVFCFASQKLTINLGSGSEALAKALDEWFAENPNSNTWDPSPEKKTLRDEIYK